MNNNLKTPFVIKTSFPVQDPHLLYDIDTGADSGEGGGATFRFVFNV